jgi:hypothetical protein
MWNDEEKRGGGGCGQMRKKGGGCGMIRTRIWNDEKKEEEDVD